MVHIYILWQCKHDDDEVHIPYLPQYKVKDFA